MHLRFEVLFHIHVAVGGVQLFVVVCNDLALQVSDLDAGPMAAEPVAVRTEALGTRDVPTI